MPENVKNAMLGVYGSDIGEIIKAALEFMRDYGSSLDKCTAECSNLRTTPDGELFLACTSTSTSTGSERRLVKRSIFKYADCTDFNRKVRVWLAGAIKGMAKLDTCHSNYRKYAIAANSAWNRTNDETTARFRFTFAQAYAVYDILMDRKTNADKYGETAKKILSAGPNDPVLTELETYRQTEIAKAQSEMNDALKAANAERDKTTSAAWEVYWNAETRIKEECEKRIKNVCIEIDTAIAELARSQNASGESQAAAAA